MVDVELDLFSPSVKSRIGSRKDSTTFCMKSLLNSIVSLPHRPRPRPRPLPPVVNLQRYHVRPSRPAAKVSPPKFQRGARGVKFLPVQSCHTPLGHRRLLSVSAFLE